MVIQADRRLALLAVAKLAGVGGLIGLIIGILATVDGAPPGVVLIAPLGLGLASGATLGFALTLSWWIFPGRVRYAIEENCLTAYRGRWECKRIPLARVAGVDFDQQIEPFDLVIAGWFGYLSPVPALRVTLTSTANRWDPSNSAELILPRILIAGDRQRKALNELRSAIGSTANP